MQRQLCCGSSCVMRMPKGGSPGKIPGRCNALEQLQYRCCSCSHPGWIVLCGRRQLCWNNCKGCWALNKMDSHHWETEVGFSVGSKGIGLVCFYLQRPEAMAGWPNDHCPSKPTVGVFLHGCGSHSSHKAFWGLFWSSQDTFPAAELFPALTGYLILHLHAMGRFSSLWSA